MRRRERIGCQTTKIRRLKVSPGVMENGITGIARISWASHAASALSSARVEDSVGFDKVAIEPCRSMCCNARAAQIAPDNQ